MMRCSELRFDSVRIVWWSCLAVTKLVGMKVHWPLNCSTRRILNRLLMGNFSFGHVEIQIIWTIVFIHIFCCMQNLLLFYLLLGTWVKRALNVLLWALKWLVFWIFTIAHSGSFVSHRILLEFQNIPWLRCIWHCLWRPDILKIILLAFSEVRAYWSWFFGNNFALNVRVNILIDNINLIDVDIWCLSYVAWKS